jgi:hypothetical protein
VTDNEVRTVLGVQRTIMNYTHFGDSGNFEGFTNQFTEDGVLETIGRQNKGRAGITEFLTLIAARFGSAEGFFPARHHVASIAVEPIDDDHAKASSYFTLTAGYGPDHWGRYRDQLERHGDVWLFTHRRVYVEGSIPNSPLRDQVERRKLR